MRHVVYDITDAMTWICWGGLAVVWLVGAALAKRRAPEVGSRSGHDLPSIAGFVLGAAVVLTPESVWRSLTIGSSWLRIVGAILLALATGGTVWARLALGEMWSSGVIAKTGHQLRTSGPYRITRHPIYTGILAMLLGTALVQGLGRWAALLVAVAIVLSAKLRAEERLLVQEFPEEYEDYRQSVPALLPRWVPRGN